MRKILRSFVVTMAAVAALTTGTAAYFTANATSTGNQITTGTMVLYVGTNQTPTGDNTGKWVVYADKIGNHQVGNFEPVTNVQPGETKSVYAVVANYGSLPFRYQATAGGSWATVALNNSYMHVTNAHRYAAGNCEADAKCEDIYYWLTNAGYTNISGGATNYATPSSIGGNLAEFELANLQFTIYRVDLMLDTAADNTYQGETFNYTLSVNGFQNNL